jgi:hypothetical protein
VLMTEKSTVSQNKADQVASEIMELRRLKVR